MAYALEEYELPSHGILEGIPKTVTLRNMTTAEEKMLLGSSDDAFDTIIGKCVTKPENFDIGTLISADKHFLLTKLRVVSYGPEYHFSYRCPYCGKVSEFSINLDDLDVKYLPEDFEEPYAVFNLPVCKDEIALKIPRVEDLKSIKMKAKRYNKKFPEAVGDISLIYGIMANIATINGKEMGASELQRYVEELAAMDASFIRNKINKLEVGIDTTIYEECPKCHEDLEFAMPMGPEFFHSRLGE
jgi:rRNA maturation protein Nop10